MGMTQRLLFCYCWTAATTRRLFFARAAGVMAREASSSSSTTRDGDQSNNIEDAAAHHFFVIHRERGTVRDDLPLWASRVENPMRLSTNDSGQEAEACQANGHEDEDADDNSNIEDDTEDESSSRQRQKVQRVEVPNVPGAFQLLNVLTEEEANRIVQTLDTLGFTQDAAVSLPRSVRHNDNLNWIADDTTLDILWRQCQEAFVGNPDGDNKDFLGQQPVGLNGKFRVYKYGPGDYFQTHTDGSWPGSRVRDGRFVQNAFADSDPTIWSLYTFLIFLTDDFEGGETEFWVNRHDPTKPATRQDHAKLTGIKTPKGGALVFPHGEHPLHCHHSSAVIKSGVKIIIRSDVLFEQREQG